MDTLGHSVVGMVGAAQCIAEWLGAAGLLPGCQELPLLPAMTIEKYI